MSNEAMKWLLSCVGWHTHHLLY